MSLVKITDDLYDIAWRLKAVNSEYELFYNAEKGRYQVHDKKGALAFVVPFDELDARTVDYALRTRIQNARRIFEEVERNNARLERRAIKNATETLVCVKERRKNET